jgi:parallel beta-helix repeat protein
VSNTILGNLIGLDASGGVSLPNEYQGIAVYEGADYTTVGGAAPGHGNTIAGNESSGILLWSDHNLVEGNLIGLDMAGSQALPNGTGIQINSGAVRNAIRDNVISGNRHGGVAISDSGTMSNTISGNLIGTNAAGTAVISSGGAGVDIHGEASHNLVGGDTPAEGNIIAGLEQSGVSTTGWGNRIAYNEVFGNAVHGVHVKGTDALTNTVTHNSIHHNAESGIKLENGGNASLPAPAFTSWDLAGGTIAGTSCALCTVEVFSDDEDEGETFEGISVADGSGRWSLDTGAPFDGPNLTATATDPGGNTSEFGLVRHRVYLPVVLRNAWSP